MHLEITLGLAKLYRGCPKLGNQQTCPNATRVR